MNTPTEIRHINLNIIDSYPNHPFKLIEGTRLEEMVSSIKINGILEPIIVRPTGERFQILSGHNRTNAARIAEWVEVPCLVIQDLSDDEADIIVSGSNLNQRSFSDMVHSERAKAIKLYFDAIKSLGKQGQRTDLFSIIENVGINGTYAQREQKLTSRDKTGEKFGLSHATVARYVRITHLTDDFIDMLDNDKIGIVSAVNISYLSESEQALVFWYITGSQMRISLDISKTLKDLSKKGDLNNTTLDEIFHTRKTRGGNPSKFRLSEDIYKRFFKSKHSDDEVNDIIAKALETYFNGNSASRTHVWERNS